MESESQCESELVVLLSVSDRQASPGPVLSFLHAMAMGE